MAWMHPAAIEERHRRFTRPDAERYLKPNPEYWLSPAELKLEYPELYERKYGRLLSSATTHAAGTPGGEADANPLDDPEVRRLLAEIKFELVLWKLRRKYRPDQPRVPAGNLDGGQWTGEGVGANTEDSTSNPLESFAAARRRGRPMAYCLRQLAIDNLYCASLEPASVRAACRSQAMERFANCIVGRPIPPLPF
jgi:hypothetical protein